MTGNRRRHARWIHLLVIALTTSCLYVVDADLRGELRSPAVRSHLLPALQS